MLVQYVVPDRDHDVDRRNGGVRLGRVLLQNAEQLAELNDLVDPKDVLLECAGDLQIEPGQARQFGEVGPATILISLWKSTKSGMGFLLSSRSLLAS